MFWCFKMKTLCMQSTCALCKVSKNNAMMTRFFGDETTLKTILLMCDPIVISNALVSYVIGLEEKFQLLMSSIGIGLSFSTKANLCCWTNYLLMKNAYALKSINVLFPFP